MPAGENSICATCRCTLDGKCARSIGHHAPEAPKPAIVWAATALTLATGRFVGSGTVAAGDAPPVVVLEAAVEAGCVVDEHAARTKTMTASAVTVSVDA